MVMAALALLVSLDGLAMQGQPNAPLVQVPATIPAPVFGELTAERQGISERIRVHNGRVAEFLNRCGPGKVAPGPSQEAQMQACLRDQGPLQEADKRLQQDKIAFAKKVAAAERCAPLHAQLARDREAMRRLARTMELTSGELRDATRASLDAQKEAILGGGSLLLGVAVKQLAERANSARAFKGWLTRHPNEARRRGLDPIALEAKIERALQGYARAAAEAEAGRIGDAGLGVADLFKGLKREAESVFALQQDADRAMLEVLSNPSIDAFRRDLVRANVQNAADLARSVTDVLSTASELAKFGPHYSLASYLVDYSVNGTKWALSLIQIQDQSFVLGKEAQAMQALQDQIERTTARLNVCLAG